MKYTFLRHRQTGFKAIRNNETNIIVYQQNDPLEYARLRKLARNNMRVQERNNCMKDLGLVSYRNASGSVCWE